MPAEDRVHERCYCQANARVRVDRLQLEDREAGPTVNAHREFARHLGADLVINTREDDFVERVTEWTGGRGVDVVIDNLGGDVLPRSIDAVRPQGVVVVFGFTAGTESTIDVTKLFFPQKKLRGTMASDIEDLTWGLELIRAGRIKPSLDRTLPLSETAESHRLISTNQVTGNIVLLPWAA